MILFMRKSTRKIKFLIFCDLDMLKKTYLHA